MRLPILFTTIMLFANASLALAADPVGHYTVEGKNPGGDGSYTGIADVTKTGDTYHVVWTIEGERYIGTAIGDKSFMAISYKSGGNTGLALYGEEGANWAGAWTYAGGTKLGIEHWIRQ
jgi:hypothetical protein